MKRLLLLLLLMLAVAGLSAQSQIMVQVSAPEDDLEESLTDGSPDDGSSDLELGSQNTDGSDPQLVGVRFADLGIPKGALILNARIVFTVDEADKNADPAVITIKAQDADNPGSFDGSAMFSISSRPTLADSVVWNLPDGGWTEADANGPDQTTPNLASLVQALVNRDGWAAGNAMVFTLAGTGTRTAESFDGEPASAPMLIVDYIETVAVSAQVSASSDDVEESLDDGGIDVTSSDLELGSENSDGSNPQLVGIRFAGVDIPAGAVVTNASIQFTVDEPEKIAGDGMYTIRAEMSPNAAPFDGTNGEVTARSTFSTTVDWTVADGTWNNAGDAGAAQRTVDISDLVNAVISQEGWAAGNAMVFTIEGNSSKVAVSFDNDPAGAPKLVINTLESPISDEIMTVLEGCDDTFPMGDEEELELEVLGTYRTGIFDEGAAEIVAFDKLSNRLFSTNADANTITVLDIVDPSNPMLVTEFDMSTYGDGVNSVAAFNGVVAVAVEADPVTDNGLVVFFDNLGNELNQVEVGPLPDMVTFTNDGRQLLVANEGEPNDEYTIDPEGSVSIIDLSGGVESATVETVTFDAFNDKRVSLQNRGVRIFGPNASVAQDLEPEYITISEDNTRAFVALQENNALAVIDIPTATLLDIQPLGYKDYNSGRPKLNEFVLNELIDLPDLGTPRYDGGQPTVKLGGFSGLYFDEGESTETSYVFYAIPDRGPNDGAVSASSVTPAAPANLRPFKLPDYQGRIAKFTLDLETGEVTLDDQIFLTQQDGTPISGRGNVEGFDEVPVTYTHDRDDEGLGDIFTEDFQGPGLGVFTQFSVASDADWAEGDFRDDLFAEANGFGADEASDDWLISPVFDLSGESSAFLSFVSTKNFDGGALEVLISTDYDGTSDPTGFTWDNITDQFTFSQGNFEIGRAHV